MYTFSSAQCRLRLAVVRSTAAFILLFSFAVTATPFIVPQGAEQRDEGASLTNISLMGGACPVVNVMAQSVSNASYVGANGSAGTLTFDFGVSPLSGSATFTVNLDFDTSVIGKHGSDACRRRDIRRKQCPQRRHIGWQRRR